MSRLRAAAVAAAVLLVAAGCPTAPTGPDGGAPRVRIEEAAREGGAPAGDGARPGGAPADPVPDDVRRYVADLDDPNAYKVYHAAIELLKRGALAPIAEQLEGQRGDQQKTLIMAIADFPGHERAAVARGLVTDAIPVLRRFLGHGDADLRAESIRAFAAFDALDPNDDSDPVHLEVLKIVAEPDPDAGPTATERVSAVRVIGRKTPYQAIPILKDLFRAAAIADVREAIRSEIRDITGESFAGPAEVDLWWEKNRTKTQSQWYRDLRDRDLREKQAARDAARALWNRIMDKLATENPQQYSNEVRSSLLSSPIPGVRIDAAKRLLGLGGPELYDVFLGAIQDEADLEVKAAMLREALAERPPADPAIRDNVIRRLLPLIDAREKPVRLAAVIALGQIKADTAVPRLLGRLANPNRDSAVARAVLVALTNIEPRAEMQVTIEAEGVEPRSSTIGRELCDFLKQEVERPANNPLRDPSLIQSGAVALGKLKYGRGVPEADRAVELLARLLGWNDPSDARAVGVMRTVAAVSLASLGRPAALPDLASALDDKDVEVAAEAARAIGAIAGGEHAAEKDRLFAVRKLQQVFDGTRDRPKDAALDAVRAVLKADQRDLARYREVADRLNQAKDNDRLIRLLKDLPNELSQAATPAAKQVHVYLRAALAEAYQSAAPADHNAAIEIWRQLAKEDLAGFGEKLAGALFLTESEGADQVYADLIQSKGGAGQEAAKWWGLRLQLANKLSEKEPRKARDIVDRMKKDAMMPAAIRSDVADLDRKLEKAGFGSQSPGAAPSVVPASAPGKAGK